MLTENVPRWLWSKDCSQGFSGSECSLPPVHHRTRSTYLTLMRTSGSPEPVVLEENWDCHCFQCKGLIPYLWMANPFVKLRFWQLSRGDFRVRRQSLKDTQPLRWLCEPDSRHVSSLLLVICKEV